MENNLEAINEALESLEDVDFEKLSEGHKEMYLNAHGTLMAISTDLEALSDD